MRALLLLVLRTRSTRLTALLLCLEDISVSHTAISTKLSSASDMLADCIDLLLDDARDVHGPSLTQRTVVLVDATHTTCKETVLRHHVAIELGHAHPLELHLTQGNKRGETFRNFKPRAGELWIGDRAYCGYAGFSHVTRAGADFLVRLRRGYVWYDSAQRTQRISLDDLLATIAPGESMELHVWGTRNVPGVSGPLRLLLKNMGADFGRNEIKRQKLKKARMTPALKRWSQFVMLLTSAQEESAEMLWELFRGRWQIELYFKELKSVSKMEPPKELRAKGRVLGWARAFWVGELVYQRWLGLRHLKQEMRWEVAQERWRLRQLMWPEFVAALTKVRQPPEAMLRKVLCAPTQRKNKRRRSYYSRLQDSDIAA